MPYAVYVNILAILVFTLGHLKFAITESEKNSVYYKKYPNQFVNVNRSVSRFLKMKHSVVHKPLLFEMFFSIVYIVLGVINICEYYNSGCDNWIGYTSTFHRFPVLVVIDYVIFISLVLVCRKKLGNNKE